jgi:hypothetical protein
MDFLVRIDTTAVYRLQDRERNELIERERMRGWELHAGGFLQKACLESARPESERRHLVGTRRRSAY